VPPLYDLTIVSADRIVYRGKVESLVAPGAMGSFGVLAHHAPMVAELETGELDVVTDQGEQVSFAISGGLLEVTWSGVTVLADSAEAAVEIDVARARAAQERARERLRAHHAGMDVVRAQAALRRALNRLRVARRGRREPGGSDDG